jgi:hypothetical protein
MNPLIMRRAFSANSSFATYSAEKCCEARLSMTAELLGKLLQLALREMEYVAQ